MNEKFSAQMSLICCIISILCSIVCLACIIYGFPSQGDLRFDYIGVIVSIFGILVTALIGWQIYNAVSIEDKMKAIASNASSNMIADINAIFDGKDSMMHSNFQFMLFAYTKAISLIFSAIDRYFKCENAELRNRAIEDALDILLLRLQECKELAGVHLFEEEYPDYVATLKKIGNPKSEKAYNLIKEFQNMEQDNDIPFWKSIVDTD